MSKSDGRDQDTNLRVLISQSAISRRKFLLASMSGAAATALEAGERPAAAAGGSLTSLTYSGQRWGAVQEGMAPAFTKATGIDAKIITFPISQGYARILNALGVGSSEYDVIDIDYRVGSLRIGVLRSGGSAVGYVQVGDIALLSDRPVWQVPTTLYLATTDLQVLATALSDAIVQIRALRTQSGAL